MLLSSGQMSLAQTPVDINAFFQRARGLGGEGLARKVDIRRAAVFGILRTSGCGILGAIGSTSLCIGTVTIFHSRRTAGAGLRDFRRWPALCPS